MADLTPLPVLAVSQPQNSHGNESESMKVEEETGGIVATMTSSEPPLGEGGILALTSEPPQVDIIHAIFARLPLFKLPDCRLLSKACNRLVSELGSAAKPLPNTFFVLTTYVLPPGLNKMNCIDFDAKHPNGMNIVASFPFDPDWSDIRIANVCNGLLCIVKMVNQQRTCAGILNPMTNEYFKLPPSEPRDKCRAYFYGLGFSLKTKQYKVARVSHIRASHPGENNKSVIEIFRFGKSTKWDPIDSMPFYFYEGVDGIYLNGAIYWIACRIASNKVRVIVICRLDVEDEILEEISLPQASVQAEDRRVTIRVFNGCLYASFRGPIHPETTVWMMGGRDGGGKASWKKEFEVQTVTKVYRQRLQGTANLQLIKVYENGEILCLMNGYDLLLYDPNTGSETILNDDLICCKVFWIYQMERFSFGPLRKILAADA